MAHPAKGGGAHEPREENDGDESHQTLRAVSREHRPGARVPDQGSVTRVSECIRAAEVPDGQWKGVFYAKLATV